MFTRKLLKKCPYFVIVDFLCFWSYNIIYLMLITYNINIKTLLSVPDVAHGGGLMYGIVKTI